MIDWRFSWSLLPAEHLTCQEGIPKGLAAAVSSCHSTHLGTFVSKFFRKMTSKLSQSSVSFKNMCLWELCRGRHVALDGFISPRALDTQVLLWDAEGHLCSLHLPSPSFTTSHLPDSTQLTDSVFLCFHFFGISTRLDPTRCSFDPLRIWPCLVLSGAFVFYVPFG